MKPLKFVCGLCTLLLLQAAAPAAIVVYDIVPASDPNAPSRTIQTGSRIEYMITADVLSDDPNVPDNNGLAAVIVDVQTDLGVAQPPADSLADVISENFLFPSLGTPTDDDIEQIGGSQATFATIVTGVGLDETLIVARGFLQSPDVEGTFTVTVSPDSTANVFTADGNDVPDIVAATVEVGDGFTIITDDAAPVDPGSSGDGDGTGDGDGGAAALPNLGGLGALLGMGVFGASVGIGAMFGPWGIVVGLLVGSLLGLITIFAGGA